MCSVRKCQARGAFLSPGWACVWNQTAKHRHRPPSGLPWILCVNLNLCNVHMLIICMSCSPERVKDLSEVTQQNNQHTFLTLNFLSKKDVSNLYLTSEFGDKGTILSKAGKDCFLSR